MTFKLKLIDVGRSKVNKEFVVTTSDLWKAEVEAVRECKKHLASNEVDLSEGEKGRYLVFAGYHKVGYVEIEKITEVKQNAL